MPWVRMPLSMLAVFSLALSLAFAAVCGCEPGTVAPGDDDDDVTGDDDDATGDDDDDDATGDDDDATGDDDDVDACPPAIGEALASLPTWSAVISCSSLHLGAAPDEQQQIALTVGLALHGFEYVEGTAFGLDVSAGEVTVEAGHNLLHYDCNDALWLEEIVDRRLVSTAGTVTVEVLEVHDPLYDARVDLTLDSVVVTDEDDPAIECALPTFTFAELAVGWLPG